VSDRVLGATGGKTELLWWWSRWQLLLLVFLSCVLLAQLPFRAPRGEVSWPQLPSYALQGFLPLFAFVIFHSTFQGFAFSCLQSSSAWRSLRSFFFQPVWSFSRGKFPLLGLRTSRQTKEGLERVSTTTYIYRLQYLFWSRSINFFIESDQLLRKGVEEIHRRTSLNGILHKS